MHELALARDIVDQVNAVIARERLEGVTRVVLELGTEAGVEVDALRFGFQVAVRDTLLQSAVLEIERVANSHEVRVKAIDGRA